MIIKVIKNFTLLLSGIALLSCSGERRVDGEMAFDSGSLMNMAESFMQAGDYGNAMRLYQRAANENPHHVASRLGLAKTYQALGATDAAINFYEQVLRLQPDNMEAKMGTGQMLITRNRPADAIPYLMELSKEDPKNYRIFNMLGLAHDLMGKQEEAQMNYGQGLALAADNVSLLNNLALSFAFEGQYAPSIKLLSKAINLDYSVTKAQQNLVLVYVLSGEEEAGRKIGASIMTEEEMVNNIRHYQWVRSLTPSERAQAIFLSIKNFPNKKKQNAVDILNSAKEDMVEAVPDDPKKRQLLEVLKKENDFVDQEPSQKEDNKPEVNVPVETPKSGKKAYSAKTSIHRVQLGAYPTPKIAENGWKKINRRSRGILDPYEPLVKLVTLANGKTLFRLYVGDIQEKSVANSVCDELRERKIDCLVLKTTKD